MLYACRFFRDVIFSGKWRRFYSGIWRLLQPARGLIAASCSRQQCESGLVACLPDCCQHDLEKAHRFKFPRTRERTSVDCPESCGFEEGGDCSLIDVLNTVALLRGRGVQVRSIADGIDPATSKGRLMLNMLATLAEYERELIVERVNAGISAARQNGTRFGLPLSDPAVIADKLAIALNARAKGRTAEDAARLVGWSRATLYRHQHARAARESTTT